MKSIFILFLLIINISLSAQVKSSYFLYDKEKVDLSDRNFKRYAIPQLKAMLQEYYHLLKKIHPAHVEFVKLKNHIFSTYRTYDNFSSKCREITQDCFTLLKGLYAQCRNLDSMLIKLQSEKINFTELKNEQETSNYFNMLQDLDDISMENYKLLHSIEGYLITSNTTYFPYFHGKKDIFPYLHKIKLNSEITQSFLLSGHLKKDFDACWSHFFRMVEYNVIFQKDKIFLLKRLEELNMAWNTFHMKMTKGNHKLSKTLVQTIKIMHNRWNSVLKLILRH